MIFCIVTHVQHIKSEKDYFGYAPYIREMNIWLRYVDEVLIVAPIVEMEINLIHEKYIHSKLRFYEVAEFEITSIVNLFKAVFRFPKILLCVYKTMKQSDHIHLRCPGNMGLIGAIVQIFFPKKIKSAKYAGNWDPSAKQPFTYKLQRWILSNTFLTKNMQVLVYGEWPNQTKNIKPFFTATYSVDEIQNSEFRIQNELSLRAKSRTTEKSLDSARLDKIEIDLPPTSFLFVGTLSKGKQALYAIQLVEALYLQGKKVQLDLYGEGVLRTDLERYISENKLENIISLKGNQSKETVLKAYQSSHFLILPSKSEGWPKVVAEAMFWGCVPIASPVSCVPYMMGNGSRGIILKEKLSEDLDQIVAVIHDQKRYIEMALNAQSWSQQFTTDTFDAAICKLLNA